METSTYESGSSGTGVQTLSPSLTDRQWAAAAHGAALLAALLTSWIAGVAGAVAALVVWMLVRDRSAFAAEHAREALNFNLSMFIYAALLTVLVIFTLGIGLIVASDTIISFTEFLQFRALDWLILPTYYLAHLCITCAVLSLLAHQPSASPPAARERMPDTGIPHDDAAES